MTPIPLITPRLENLPPYVFGQVNQLKKTVIDKGADLIDLAMGNPDGEVPRIIALALQDAVSQPGMHRYGEPKGILGLRQALQRWYERRFNVLLSPETEILTTLGSKEGLAHLALALCDKGDTVLVPTPSYPVHHYGFRLAGANVVGLPVLPNTKAFISELKNYLNSDKTKPKVLLINFPANPTAVCATYDELCEIVNIALEYKIWLIQDFAYADLSFDKPTYSVLSIPNAKKIAVEAYSLSKSYNIPGYRIGFISGNADMIASLTKIKSYTDYGHYMPLQSAGIVALDHCDDDVLWIKKIYQKRRDVLCAALNKMGWKVSAPEATMFVWAKIPEFMPYHSSFDLTKFLIEQAHVAVSPGICFGDGGEGYVRFSLVADEDRLELAVKRIAEVLQGQKSRLTQTG
jgi:alanine-synthesizing transaminase